MHRHALAHEARQTLRAAVAGRDPELDLRLAELRVLAGDADVTRHGELAAAAERESVDRRDDRLAAGLESPKHALAALRARLAIERPLPRQIAGVGAGDERFRARAGEDRAPDHGNGSDPLARITELQHYLIV